MRGSVLAASAADGASAAINYESRKCSHHLTEQLCAGQGLQFVPLVVEACGGGWGPAAMNTWRKLGALHAAHIGLSNSAGVQQFLQALAIAVQRENARAVLRRTPSSADGLVAMVDP